MSKSVDNVDATPPLAVSGSSLVADFVAAITNLSTAQMAKFAAEQSERDTIGSIEAATQGAVVMPQYIPSDAQESLVRSSLDAHFKKVQAEQLGAFTANQSAQMQADDRQKYIGKKVRIIILDQNSKPVESYWLNNKTGQYSNGIVKSRTVKGIIEDISLLKNMIILKPTLSSRIILPSRKYYAAYVVNPETLTPMVDILLV